MIDWHCHILPCIDDGPVNMEQSLAMATALAAAGFSGVCCTPHLIQGRFEAGNDEVRRGVALLQERLNQCNIPLKLWPGREYSLDEHLLTYLQDPLPLGDSRLILVEIPPHICADVVRQLSYNVVNAGFKPVIAHPERCRLLKLTGRRAAGRRFLSSINSLLAGNNRGSNNNEQFVTIGNPLLDYLRELGCLFQGNLGSFNGFYGQRVKSYAEALHNRGIYDLIGSDLHAPEHARHVLQDLLHDKRGVADCPK